MLFIAWGAFWVTLFFAVKLEELSIKGACVLGGLWVAVLAGCIGAAMATSSEDGAFAYGGWMLAGHAILAAVSGLLVTKGLAGSR